MGELLQMGVSGPGPARVIWVSEEGEPGCGPWWGARHGDWPLCHCCLFSSSISSLFSSLSLFLFSLLFFLQQAEDINFLCFQLDL